MLVILSILMSSMLVHGYNARDLLASTIIIISIPKYARGDMSQSDNYRGIALCSCICKLFDIILMKNAAMYFALANSNLQSKRITLQWYLS